MHTKIKTVVAALALAACGLACQVGADAIDKVIPAPALDTPAAEATGLQTAVLAGGCFWGLQGMFEHVPGVTKVVAGYSGGTKETAHYEMVGTERTGHAESVEITFDPKRISYGQLLRLYFASPTTPRSSTARARTPAPATVRRSSSPPRRRSASPRPTWRN